MFWVGIVRGWEMIAGGNCQYTNKTLYIIYKLLNYIKIEKQHLMQKAKLYCLTKYFKFLFLTFEYNINFN